MERETGIEPATSSLGSWRSTAELLPLSQERLKLITAENGSQLVTVTDAKVHEMKCDWLLRVPQYPWWL